MKKAIFFDIDGTLFDTFEGVTEISPKVEMEIRNLKKMGHYIFVATGRPYAFLSQAILDFGFDGYVLSNGAQVLIDNKNIHLEAIESAFVKELSDFCEEKKVQYILEGTLNSYLKNEFEDCVKFFKDLGVSWDLIKGEYELDNIQALKIELLLPNEEVSEFCRKFIDSKEGYNYFSSIDNKALEIYATKNTKAAAILKTLEYLNIKIENSYAFGDGMNDIEMLQNVGCGIAMGNATDEVKSYAKKVTDTVKNDGVAVGIRKYIL